MDVQLKQSPAVVSSEFEGHVRQTVALEVMSYLHVEHFEGHFWHIDESL
jgi:hypothetical protein